MTKAEREKMREILDQELTYVIKKNDWMAAWVLLNYAMRTEIISKEEYEWLDAATDCLEYKGSEWHD